MKTFHNEFTDLILRTIGVKFRILWSNRAIRFHKRITSPDGTWPRHWRRIAHFFDLELREECIQASSEYDAKDRAENRRMMLIRLFQASGAKWRPDEQTETFIQQPFIESPYEDQFHVGLEFKSKMEAVSQTVRFRWQILHDELLLADRLIDLLVGLSRYQKSNVLPFSVEVFAKLRQFPNVRIERVENIEEKSPFRSFPWVVVIETNQPEVFHSALKPFASWLGIGIDLAPGRKFTFAGKCQLGTGMEGVIGGALTTPNEQFLATCSHVLAPNCQSVICRGDPKGSQSEPDAALISSDQPCFKTGNSTPCAFLTKTDVDDCISSKIPVFKRHPDRQVRRGAIRGRILNFNLNGVMCRFPHVEVIPWNSTWRRILRAFSLPFSKPGDSGSWVFVDSSRGNNAWLGMIVGADEENPATFVAEAEPLLDFFQTATQHGPLQPQKFV